ncbi:MAG TPA: hypothetical protein VK476_03625 [Flavobacterium sp.]|nr:hypothetical protein [Flavobacterium sp.]
MTNPSDILPMATCFSFLFTEWFWAFWQFLAIVVSAILIVRQVKSQQNANLITVFNALETRWESEMMLKARLLVCVRYLRDLTNDVKAQVSGEAVYVSNFFEELGIDLKYKILPEDLIWEHYRYLIIPYYTLLKSKTAMYQQEKQEASTFSLFGFLYKRMLAVSQLNGENFKDLEVGEVLDFLSGELDRLKFRSEGLPNFLPTKIMEEFEKMLNESKKV